MRISYSVENLRRLRQTPEIEIRPITILVGRNSAGKSTFLRSLPLLRQSVETRSSAPILWFGDYVDFGDFQTAVGEANENSEAAFVFSVTDIEGVQRGRNSYLGGYYRVRSPISTEKAKVRYVVGSSGDKTKLRRIELSIPSENIEFTASFEGRTFSDNKLIIDDVEVRGWNNEYELLNVSSSLFSPPFFVAKPRENRKPARRLAYPDAVFSGALAKALRSCVARNLSDETIEREVRRILEADFFDAEAIARMEALTPTKTFKKIYRQLLNVENSFSQEIVVIRKAYRAFGFLEILEEELTEFISGVSYLAPARAASERFYRKQELEVSEIDPNGGNFPMFLDSLSSGLFNDFSFWVQSIFGFGLELKSTMGHISINLKAGSRSVNVTDTGYGVSQVLPVMGVIWWANNQPFSRRNSRLHTSSKRILAIEQPELHLHPAHQAKLADVFVGAVAGGLGNQKKQDVNFVIETHSEALINRLGELVERGDVSADDIQIVVFSAEDDIESPSKVSLAHFDRGGVLNDWPYGFFNYDQS